jgi:hypothetical protein
LSQQLCLEQLALHLPLPQPACGSPCPPKAGAPCHRRLKEDPVSTRLPRPTAAAFRRTSARLQCLRALRTSTLPAPASPLTSSHLAELHALLSSVHMAGDCTAFFAAAAALPSDLCPPALFLHQTIPELTHVAGAVSQARLVAVLQPFLDSDPTTPNVPTDHGDLFPTLSAVAALARRALLADVQPPTAPAANLSRPPSSSGPSSAALGAPGVCLVPAGGTATGGFGKRSRLLTDVGALIGRDGYRPQQRACSTSHHVSPLGPEPAPPLDLSSDEDAPTCPIRNYWVQSVSPALPTSPPASPRSAAAFPTRAAAPSPPASRPHGSPHP